jgi:hypothetical protein
MLYEALDHLEECNFDVIEQSIFENWKNLAPDWIFWSKLTPLPDPYFNL